MSFETNFGERLQSLRKDRSKTQKQVSVALEVSRGCIANWENGTRQPDKDSLKNLAFYYNTSLDYLIGRIQDPREKFVLYLNEKGEEGEFLDLTKLSAENRQSLMSFYEHLVTTQEEKTKIEVAKD